MLPCRMMSINGLFFIRIVAKAKFRLTIAPSIMEKIGNNGDFGNDHQ